MGRPFITELPDLWDRDGSLRDVYITGTTEQDWRCLLELAANYPLKYFSNEDDRTLPDAAALFAHRGVSHTLRIDVGGVWINCYFFVADEIELDIDPREVVDEASHERVLIFLEALAQATAKPVALTAENAPEAIYLSFDPRVGQWRVYAEPYS